MRLVKTHAARRGLLPALCLLLFAASCATPGIRPAPFRQRPDSVAPGDLRGPFDGRVLDDETGRPVAGAQVYAVWSYVDGFAFNAPAGYKEWLGSTDAEGRYDVPRLDAPPRGKRLAAFRLTIFKRGYVAYRSDRRFEDMGPRLDFTQRRHEVRLERWRSDISHVKHLRYVGGGGAMAELTRWEVPEAAAELGGKPVAVAKGPDQKKPDEPVKPAGPPLPAQKLLLPTDVKDITGFDGGFDVSDLGDETPSPQYNSVHLRAKNKTEDWDIAARIWHLPPADAEALYGRLIKELPGVKETNELGDHSLRAVSDAGDILGVAFLDKTRGVVVLVQCGASQCKNGDMAVNLAKRVKERTDATFAPAGANP
jgi:hypothetical protein